MKITDVNINEVVPYINNPRKNTEAVEVVCKSISEFGFQQPLVIDTNNVIIVGHTRFEAAKHLELETVPCVIADNLDEDKIKAYRIMDNKSSEYATWNFDLLTQEMLELLESDTDLSLTGFANEELVELGIEVDLDYIKEGLTDEDDAPDLPQEPVTKLGDKWLLGNHVVLCGDAISIDDVNELIDNNKPDMVFTDPPYNVAFNGRSGKFDVIKNDNLAESEFVDFIDSFISILTTLNVNTYYICCNWAFYGLLQLKLNPKTCIVWAKNVFGLGKGYRHQHEFILFDGFIDASITNESDLWNIAKDVKYKHPTQKPVALPMRAIKNSSKEKNIVLDLFGGSGSTLLACEKLNRYARVMELDEKYCDVIIQRWQDFTGKEAIHSESNLTYNELQKNTKNG